MTIDSKDQMTKRCDKPPVVALCGTAILNKKNHYQETNVPKGMGVGRMNLQQKQVDSPSIGRRPTKEAGSYLSPPKPVLAMEDYGG